MNITEKILSKKAGHEVSPGEIIEIPVDLAMSHDGTSPPAIKTFEKLADKIWDPDKIAIIFDHNVPANTIGSAEFQKVCREFIKAQNITKNFIHGEGICHQVVPEMGLVEPGMVVVGADSHTCTYGAFGAFSTGMGATDLAMVWATGKTWFMVPQAIRMEIEGEFNQYIAPKDLILNIIGEVGIAGATYKTAEFCGPTIEAMGVEGRATMCNMAIEMGAKNGIMEPNREVIDYICQKTGKRESQLNIVTSDSNAVYEKEMHFDITDLEPQIACPNDVDNVKDISKVEGTAVDQCLIGSCTNGRLSDLRDAAEILKGKKINDDTRLLILPASREIYRQAMHEGYIETFIDAGAIICNPGCGPCLGGHMGVLSEGEVCISTTNRNFKGRMGDPASSVYLSNSKVVAASAIAGTITNPKDL
ncbi:homoaconitase large subunit [Methanobrevibacter sp.]|uniref:homoaconitase large subunit n=1 Tax=Methanobrevibacter sp. TaxID=66852 RepID=UPI0025FFA549|nr:homoaconitase large subunit [Methanobrevibacter sp.]MBQ6512984.1 3-isopropylmalate dehydratase large subunit [Methanobrevibacter sp.]